MGNITHIVEEVQMEEWKEERIGKDLNAAKNTVARGVLDVDSSFETPNCNPTKNPDSWSGFPNRWDWLPPRGVNHSFSLPDFLFCFVNKI